VLIRVKLLKKESRAEKPKLLQKKQNQNPPNLCCPRQAKCDNNYIVVAEKGEHSLKFQLHAKEVRGISNTTKARGCFLKSTSAKGNNCSDLSQH